jgi:hypothetical protein
MTHRRQRTRQRRAPGPRRSRALGGCSVILALFALFLNLVTVFLPPPAMAAFNGSSAALICSSGGAPEGEDTPPSPTRHHHCQECLAQQIGGSADLPERAATLLKLPAASPILAALDQFAPPVRATSNAQSRAPPAIG